MKVDRHIVVSERTLIRIIDAAREQAPRHSGEHLSLGEIEYFLGIADNDTDRSLFEIDEHADACAFCSETIESRLERADSSSKSLQERDLGKDRHDHRHKPTVSNCSPEETNDNAAGALRDEPSSEEISCKTNSHYSRPVSLHHQSQGDTTLDLQYNYKLIHDTKIQLPDGRRAEASGQLIKFRPVRGPPTRD